MSLINRQFRWLPPSTKKGSVHLAVISYQPANLHRPRRLRYGSQSPGALSFHPSFHLALRSTEGDLIKEANGRGNWCGDMPLDWMPSGASIQHGPAVSPTNYIANYKQLLSPKYWQMTSF
jgi:hypothetical protein